MASTTLPFTPPRSSVGSSRALQSARTHRATLTAERVLAEGEAAAHVEVGPYLREGVSERDRAERDTSAAARDPACHRRPARGGGVEGRDVRDRRLAGEDEAIGDEDLRSFDEYVLDRADVEQSESQARLDAATDELPRRSVQARDAPAPFGRRAEPEPAGDDGRAVQDIDCPDLTERRFAEGDRRLIQLSARRSSAR